MYGPKFFQEFAGSHRGRATLRKGVDNIDFGSWWRLPSEVIVRDLLANTGLWMNNVPVGHPTPYFCGVVCCSITLMLEISALRLDICQVSHGLHLSNHAVAIVNMSGWPIYWFQGFAHTVSTLKAPAQPTRPNSRVGYSGNLVRCACSVSWQWYEGRRPSNPINSLSSWEFWHTSILSSSKSFWRVWCKSACRRHDYT